MWKSELLVFVWLGAMALSLLVLLGATVIPAHERRRLSDWVMVSGVTLSVSGALGLFGLFYLMESSHNRPDPEWALGLALALVFSVPGGLMVFSGGYLLSRAETRRQRLLAKVVRGAMPARMPE